MKQLSLNLQFFAGEKTEKATPKKRKDTRKKGQVAKSQDVNTAVLLFFVFLSFLFIGGYLLNIFLDVYKTGFTEFIHWDLTVENLETVMLHATLEGAKALAPVMGIAVVAGILSNYLQIGFLFSGEPLKFDLKKIDPIKGAKKIFSIRAIVELLKSMLKIVVVSAVTFFILWINKDEMMMLSLKDVSESLSFFGQVTVTMGLSASIALLAIAVFDYLYQRYDYEKNIRMSKQDIRDEYKNMEGDPQIRAKIKEKQRQMAMQRMMSEVPKADVIITNPTHYSIAIKYSEDKFDAPYVVAKGVDYIAFRIREIAKHHNIMMVENRPLARGLYDKVEIGEVIHEEFYQAVAEVLAYVYRMENKA
ncbi:flagellar biosynthesis protein FlhB [Salirhabdus sp. Marseille-P4669]|uniref:flagellar biosynthesis protein FlhB n=1 Tax=Salirhabdus sp. Marseille-P4669 TaxID=2042310 RepID=UPI000C7CCF9B|nr:flagellar biosynthesis protein FlhB [Salirhabdus sp. Marseille-P4669]